jgi:hypothetical protein
MTPMLKLVGAIALMTIFAGPGLAQWPPYPTRNVPRLADGSPDMDAPTPRTADGKPDFTGMWQARRRPFGQQQANAQPPEPPPGTPPLATFFNIGQNMKDGAPMRPWAKALRDERMADNSKDNPDAHCLPMGHMQFHLHPQPRKIIQTPDEIVILYEGNGGVRQIFTDGRTSPDNNPQPWWYGYSVGRWEGDDLVVTTTNLRDGGWLDVNGTPLTDQATLTERFRRPSFGYMEIDVTIDDPKAYTEPFTVRVDHQIMVDSNLIEFICIENERSSYLYDP